MADSLSELRAGCEGLLRLHGDDAQLSKALSALYYSFKSLKFVPPRINELLTGTYEDVCIKSDRADEACYLAEMMIRSLHPVGDLLAQVVNISVLDSKHGRSKVSLGTVLHDDQLPSIVHRALVDIRGSHSYDYIEEFTNACKHREFIERVVIHDDNHQRIEFQPFERCNGKRERKREFLEVLDYGRTLHQKTNDTLALLEDRLVAAPNSAIPPSSFTGAITGTATLQDSALLRIAPVRLP